MIKRERTSSRVFRKVSLQWLAMPPVKRRHKSSQVLNFRQWTLYIDLLHKWRLLHENEARMLFSQSVLISTTKLTLFKVNFRVRFKIWIILLFSDFSKDKTEKYVSLVVGNKYWPIKSIRASSPCQNLHLWKTSIESPN